MEAKSSSGIKLPHPNTIIIYASVIYTIGLVGLIIPSSSSLFISLVPLNILLALALILIYHPPEKKSTIMGFIFIYLAGFLIEWVGVKTSLIFGEYEYGNGLGYKIDGVPVVMGFNWLLLVYSAGVIGGKYFKKRWQIAIIGA